MNAITLNPTELTELKAAAAYISGLPPLDEWVEIRPLLEPRTAANTELFWCWVGKSLDAFFSDRSDPISESGLHPLLQQVIQEQTSEYIVLSALLFQAEKFIKLEAQQIGLPYPFTSRSDLLKVWALEGYRWSCALWLQECFESPTAAQMNERLGDYRKFFRGEVALNEREKRWAKEDAKRHGSLPSAQIIQPWTYFCMCVFEKYKGQLPALRPFLESFGPPASLKNFKKFGIIDQRYREYPGRGKAGAKKKKL